MRRFATMCMGLAMVAGSTFAFDAMPVLAAPVQEGKEWRELNQTTGLSWAAIATVCPTDGVTPCNGSVGGTNLTGWTWATAPQTLALMDDYYPGLASLNPPAAGGIAGFWASIGFLGDMQATGYTSLTYFYSEWAYGWTASQGASGLPIGGGAEFSHALTGSTANGNFGIAESADRADAYTGAFLFRVAGLDYTPPTVTPTVTGILGANGWYRSDVGVSWTVADAQSPIDSTTGCGISTLALDASRIDYTCSATSFGGTGTGTVSIKRDNTPPTVACIGPAPTFDLGQQATISGTVSDAMSGAVNVNVSTIAYTGAAGAGIVYLVGVDNAGNQGGASCPFNVVIPSCLGKVPTIVGTSGNDTITGTAKADVILSLGGNDTIDGGGGADTICPGDGDDLVYGGLGIDKVDGGAGDDDLNGGGSGDDLNGGAGYDSIRGDAGADRCSSGEARMSSCAYIY